MTTDTATRAEYLSASGTGRRSTRGGAPPTTCRWVRSTCSPTRSCASRSARAHQAAPARPLGHDARTELRLRAHEPGDPRAGPEHDLHHRSRPRRPRAGRERVPGRDLQRGLPAHRARHEGLRRLFRQFSFPGGIPSHVAPETPGSIHEGGELGYSLLHAYGAVLDNPDLIALCVVGDGEAETGPLAASWHSNKFLNPVRRRRGAAGAAPERLQDRQPDGARADLRARSCGRCSRGTATRRGSSRDRTPT